MWETQREFTGNDYFETYEKPTHSEDHILLSQRPNWFCIQNFIFVNSWALSNANNFFPLEYNLEKFFSFRAINSGVIYDQFNRKLPIKH